MPNEEKRGIGPVFSKVKGVWRRSDSADSKRQPPAIAPSAAVNVGDVAAPVTITESRAEDAPKSPSISHVAVKSSEARAAYERTSWEYSNPVSRSASPAAEKSVPHDPTPIFPDARTDEDTTTGSQPIYDIAKECVVLFGKSPLQPTNYFKETISRCQRRFRLWATYLGVFAHKSVNLDTRLKMEPDVRDLVMLLLDVLHTDLRRLIKLESRGLISQRSTLSDRSGNTNSNDDTRLLLSSAATGALEGIVGSVDRLHRLAARIRISTRDDLGLEEKISNFAKLLPRDDFEDMTRLILRYKFPKAEERLIMKLTKSITFRRHRLLYQRHYHKKLNHGQHPSATEVVRQPSLMNIAGKSELEKQHQIMVEPGKQQNPQNQSLHQREIVPDTEPGTSNNLTFLGKDRVDWQDDRGEQQVPTNFPVDSSWMGEIDYPSPPEADTASIYAMCQLCFQEIQVVGNEDPKWWEKHVDSDMDHYVCLSDNCEKSLCYFKSSDSWLEHMNSAHQSDWPRFIYVKKNEWRCPLSKKHNIPFESEGLLRTHLLIDHSDDLSPTDLQLVVDNSRFPEPRDPDICPLCEDCIDGSEPVAQQWEVENENPHDKIVRWSDEKQIIRRDLPDEEKEKLLAASINSSMKFSTERSIKLSKTKPSTTTHISRHLKSVSFLSLWGLEPEKEEDRRYEDSRAMIRRLRDRN